MSAAFLALNFGANHPVAVIGNEFYVLAVGRLGETRPASAGIEFGIGREKLIAAHGAFVHPLIVGLPIFSGKGLLCASLSGYII